MTGTAVRGHRGLATGVALGLVAVLAVWAILVAPPETAVVPTAAPEATASATASATAGPTATAAPSSEWAPLELAALAAPVSLEATRPDGARVERSTSFRLRASGTIAVADLAVSATPLVSFRRDLAADGSLLLTPAGALLPNERYEIVATASDGTVAGTWTFRSSGPLRVADTIPGDGGTSVPTDTGIEVTFDQDGVVGAAERISIEPTVRGTFRQRGRTVVFVPAEPLEPRTLYTVTIAAGIGLEGSSQVLETPVVARFETAAADAATPTIRHFGRVLLEASTTEPAVLSLDIAGGSSTERRDAIGLDVHRLAGPAAAADAIVAIATAPRWSVWSRDGLVPTAGLTRVLRTAVRPARISQFDSALVAVTLPEALPAGWYLVTETGADARPAQLVLQVTDIASYLAVTATDSILWANDLATGGPLSGATLAVLGRPGTIGTTDADGLLRAPLPAAVQAAAATVDMRPDVGPEILAVTTTDGRASLVPVGLGEGWSAYAPNLAGGSGSVDPWWDLLETDQQTIRQTDTIEAWGFVRPRDAGDPPASAELRLVMLDWAVPADERPAIASATVAPRASGAFAGSIAVRDLPFGSYLLQLRVGDEVVTERWMTVAELRKPSLLLSIATDRHVYLAGETARVEILATFFDGTPAPAVPVQVEGWGEARVVTGADGRARLTRTVAVDDALDPGWGYQTVRAFVVGDAEGLAQAATAPLVFAADRIIEGAFDASGATGTLAGTVSRPAIARLEAGWADHPTTRPDLSADPIADARVTWRLVEHRQVVVRTVATYDFIAKRVVRSPIYEQVDITAGSGTLRTDASGRFRLALPGLRETSTYDLRLRSVDAEGRETGQALWRTFPFRGGWQEFPSLTPTDGTCRSEWSCAYRTGDRVAISLGRNGIPDPDGGRNRYLWLTLANGLRDATVGTSSTFRSTFSDTDVPSYGLLGVRFTGRTFLPAIGTRSIRFDPSERGLTVRITADRDRYAPGQTARLSVTATDASGTGVAATVAIRVIDEKLYAAGYASDSDPLPTLYAELPTGLIRTWASHPLPLAIGGDGYGDTTGGDRSIFRDRLLNRLVETDATGHASVSVALSDDLTSWRAVATALTDDVRAGVGTLVLPTGLPFFVDASIAPTYLVGERPILLVRTYGAALAAGDPVTVTVGSATIPMTTRTVVGTAFQPVAVELPALPAGTHEIRIAATAERERGQLADAMVRTITVVGSRFTTLRTASTSLDALPDTGDAPLVAYRFTDAGRGLALAPLLAITAGGTGRVDVALAAELARETILAGFGEDAAAGTGIDASGAAVDPIDVRAYVRDGLVGLLPYASPDPALTGRLAALVPDRMPADAIVETLRARLAATDTTRETRAFLLAGLAGLGDDVAGAIRDALAAERLTVRERLWLAIGAARAGDAATARSVERTLLAADGQGLGNLVRLRTGTPDETLEATALVAVAASLAGDTAIGAGAARYVAEQPSETLDLRLETAVALARLVPATPPAAVSFAWSVAGERHVVDLAAGRTVALTLTAAQRRSLILEPLAGDVGVTTTWEEPVDPATLVTADELRLARAVVPSGTIDRERTVRVTLTVTFRPGAPQGAYEVMDLAPSGLAPLPYLEGVADAGAAATCASPTAIEGQRVRFVLGRGKGATATLCWFARVVTPGTYAWEPAIIRAIAAPDLLAVTPSREVTIR